MRCQGGAPPRYHRNVRTFLDKQADFGYNLKTSSVAPVQVTSICFWITCEHEPTATGITEWVHVDHVHRNRASGKLFHSLSTSMGT